MTKITSNFWKRSIYAALILFLIIPAFALTYFGNMPGRIIGMVIFILVAALGLYEVCIFLTKNYFLITCFCLFLLMGIFLLPHNSSLKIIHDGAVKGISLKEQIYHNFGLETFLVPFATVILFLLADKNLRANFKILCRNFVILLITSFLTAFLAKGVWIINIFDWSKLIFIIAIGVFSDTFAYIGGTIFGKKLFRGAKLAPRISPSKTWAGAIISFVITSLFGALTSYYIHFWDGVHNWILLSIIGSLILAFFAQVGDLLFSGFKRILNTKDFSALIPIHGGIFDRVDGISAVMFVTIILFIVIF